MYYCIFIVLYIVHRNEYYHLCIFVQTELHLLLFLSSYPVYSLHIAILELSGVDNSGTFERCNRLSNNYLVFMQGNKSRNTCIYIYYHLLSFLSSHFGFRQILMVTVSITVHPCRYSLNMVLYPSLIHAFPLVWVSFNEPKDIREDVKIHNCWLQPKC